MKPKISTLDPEVTWWAQTVQATEGYGFNACQPTDGMVSSYVLCSEKDQKQVVICIKQAQDNPKQAEEIFSTFRWTE